MFSQKNLSRLTGAIFAVALILVGYVLAPDSVQAWVKASAATFTSTVTMTGTVTQSGATTHSGAVTHSDSYTHSGTGAHTISTTGAYTRSGAAATTTFSETGAWTRSGTGTTVISSTGAFTRSGTGVNTFSSSGASTFSGGDILGTGADTDVTLSGATSDFDTTGGGSYKIDGNKIIDCDTVTISTGELLALAATPKVLVAAPGANLFVAVQSVTLGLDYATTAYDGVAAGEDLSIQYVGGAVKVTQDIETTGFLDQANDELRFVNGAPQALAAAAAADPLVPTVNAGVDITLLTGEIATGDSPLDVRICYSIQPDLLD